jgi:SAM-dependent methyltransferase
MGCGRFYECRAAIWRFLASFREARLEPFVAQYRAVREREGRRSSAPEYYRQLPHVARGDAHAADWAVRRETYRHLLGHVLAAGPQPARVLDLGAGSAWLSHRLASLGHHAVAVDAIDDDVDGLGAARHFATPLTVVQADFDALPFAPGQFDLIVFNGSLHYAPDPEATLHRAHHLLASGGALVVMDSPMFRLDRAGVAMVDEQNRRFAQQHGWREVARPGAGYLTFASLDAIAEALSLTPRFIHSHGPWSWRLRRSAARLRLFRSPAAFGVWVAR